MKGHQKLLDGCADFFLDFKFDCNLLKASFYKALKINYIFDSVIENRYLLKLGYLRGV